MSKVVRDIKDLFPMVIDGITFNGLREAVTAKNPGGSEAYNTVYKRLRSGWPVFHAILLPPRSKEV